MQLSLHNVTKVELGDLRSLDGSCECYVRDLHITYRDATKGTDVTVEITMFSRNQDNDGRELKVLS